VNPPPPADPGAPVAPPILFPKTSAVFGIPWPDAAHLTLSFAPDGTPVGSQVSRLAQVMDPALPPAEWQMTVLRAFQTWAASANLNVGVVPDGGQAFGSAGLVQGDSRFGDVRVAAAPLSAEELAVAIPFAVTAGTWAGDLIFSDSARFGAEAPGVTDLFSVALHEAGHVLGLPESADAGSAMFPTLGGRREAPTALDLDALRALYGERAADGFDAEESNDRRADASRLRLSNDEDEPSATLAEADLTSHGDVDWYWFEPEFESGGLTVQLKTSGFSLTVARLTVLDEGGRVLASQAAADPLHGDVTFRFTDLREDERYFLRVESAANDVFGVGGYRVELRPDGAGPDDPEQPRPSELPEDFGENDTLGDATDLRRESFTTDARYDYAAEARLSAAGDVDFFRVRAPQADEGLATALVVTAWGRTPGGLTPALRVYDEDDALVPAEVLINADGLTAVQVLNPVPNDDYFVEVRAAADGDRPTTGPYYFGADFQGRPVRLETFAQGTLSQGERQAFRSLGVVEGQVFHWTLSVPQAEGESAVRMTLFGPDGAALLSLTSRDGETRSAAAYLPTGSYTIRFSAGTPDGRPVPPLAFLLKGLGVSTPIGPVVADPRFRPQIPGQPVGPDITYFWVQFSLPTYSPFLDTFDDRWWFRN
jgi:hypothetical protein